MEIRQFKILELIQTKESQMTAKLEIDKTVRNVKIDFQQFEDGFYGFQMPEDVQVILRNYPALSQKVISHFSDYLKDQSRGLPMDFSFLVRRQNINLSQPEKQAA
jgi:hypothetical protein